MTASVSVLPPEVVGPDVACLAEGALEGAHEDGARSGGRNEPGCRRCRRAGAASGCRSSESRRGDYPQRRRLLAFPVLIVRVLSFATALDAVGSAETEHELPDGSTIADLIERLTAAYPDLALLWPRLAVAVDGEVAADRAAPLHDGAEVALLPPVSGGSCGATAGPAA